MPDGAAQARAAAALRAALARPVNTAVPPASASVGGLGRASKWVGAGLIGVAVFGGLTPMRMPTPPQIELAPSSAAVPPRAGRIEAPAPAPARASEPVAMAAPPLRRREPSDGQQSGAHRPRARSSAPARSVAPSADVHAPAPSAPEGPGLAEEIRAIEAIQGLVGWGRAAHATRALADYRGRFPRGELALEADLLEVDVAVLAGDRARAQALARELLARPAAGRYRARLDALLAPGGGASKLGSKAAPAQMNGRR
jgi:hypothetical protein